MIPQYILVMQKVYCDKCKSNYTWVFNEEIEFICEECIESKKELPHETNVLQG